MLLTTPLSFEICKSSFRLRLTSAFEPSLVFAIHRWLWSSVAEYWMKPSCYCSWAENLCCISLQMKSWASSETLRRRLRITTRVYLRFWSNWELFSSTLRTAWARQHCLFIFLSWDTYSSFTMSRPSVAQIVNTTPRSNKSCFLSSLRDVSKLSSWGNPAVLPCWIRRVNLSLSKFYLFLKFCVPSQSKLVRVLCWLRVL